MPPIRQPALPPKAGPGTGPILVATRTRYSALALWHLLSLDAPTVAATWTWFVARCAGIALPWAEPAAMFVAVWMIYAADRLLDARAIDLGPQNHARLLDIEERHRFHHRYRGRFFAAMMLAACGLLYLLHRIAPAALGLYALLATLLAVWMLLIHARATAVGTRRLPKELAVGVFFPAAVFIPTVARAPALQPELLPVALLFSGVCSLNCLFLYAWEHPNTRARAQAHWTTLAALGHLRQLAGAVLLLAATIAIFGAWHTWIALAPALACGLSTAMLLLLHLRRATTSTLHQRALADLVLLTPLLLLPLAWPAQ